MSLRSTLLIASAFTVVSQAAEDIPVGPRSFGPPPTVHKDRDSIDARGFPPYTEIKDPYTGRIWIVQPDGTGKLETSIPRIRGTLTLIEDRLLFATDTGTEIYVLAKVPGMKLIKYDKKQITKDGKAADVSEAVIDIYDGSRLTFVSGHAVPITRIADGDYVRWKQENKK